MPPARKDRCQREDNPQTQHDDAEPVESRRSARRSRTQRQSNVTVDSAENGEETDNADENCGSNEEMWMGRACIMLLLIVKPDHKVIHPRDHISGQEPKQAEKRENGCDSMDAHEI